MCKKSPYVAMCSFFSRSLGSVLHFFNFYESCFPHCYHLYFSGESSEPFVTTPTATVAITLLSWHKWNQACKMNVPIVKVKPSSPLRTGYCLCNCIISCRSSHKAHAGKATTPPALLPPFLEQGKGPLFQEQKNIVEANHNQLRHIIAL
ncbi:hypothetical protein TRVL_02842 [Trypanosoma vivax]|nr:hypothetical protein TRVL_02842 [Trypanosoma vivax]